MESTDIALIGAGPIGLEMAVALKQAGLDYLHFDAAQVGHTISWFAPQTRFFSSNERIAIAGVPLQTPDQGKCTREQYLAYLRSVVLQFDLKIRTFEPMVGIDRDNDGFLLTTHPRGGTRQIRTRRVILATGGTAHPRQLGIKGENLPHVSNYFQDPHLYFQKNLLIVGGKNSAVEAALRCHQAGANVVMSYRRDQFNPNSIKYWLLPEINGLNQSGKIPAHFNTLPMEITPTHVLLSGPDGRTIHIPADFVLLMIGYQADLSLCKLAGIELDGPCQLPRHDPSTMRTNVPGLYVAGTVTGGTQDQFTVFLENCHIHVQRILADLTGNQPPAAPMTPQRPES
ncbi:MAG: NAD(P)-binding domain-containing protein [Phycisphaerales bacterium]|nr:NAD(P)-binding domain-containing protein [Phycisphaerales bacterium]